MLPCSPLPCQHRLPAPGWPAHTACWQLPAGPPGHTHTLSAPRSDRCGSLTTSPAARPPHHSSANVAMDKVLPADLSAVVPEVEVEQNRAQARRRHRQVAEVLFIPGDVPLHGHSGNAVWSFQILPFSAKWHQPHSGVQRNWTKRKNLNSTDLLQTAPPVFGSSPFSI